MVRSRHNRSTLTPEEMARGHKFYEDWHWGSKAQYIIDWDDPDYPEGLVVGCGRLMCLHVRIPRAASNSAHPRRARDTRIQFSHEAMNESHVAYDPNHPYQRLYLLISPAAQAALKHRFWDENDVEPRSLREWARLAGGRHSKTDDYPNVMAKPIGVCTGVMYFTHKQGDDPASPYLHQMGEQTHYFPILGVDEPGRLWLLGGNYTSPTAGITD